jgi:hypothetical protein
MIPSHAHLPGEHNPKIARQCRDWGSTTLSQFTYVPPPHWHRRIRGVKCPACNPAAYPQETGVVGSGNSVSSFEPPKQWWPGADAWSAAASRSGADWFSVRDGGKSVVDGGPGPAVSETESPTEEAKVEVEAKEQSLAEHVEEPIDTADAAGSVKTADDVNIVAEKTEASAAGDQVSTTSPVQMPISTLRSSEPPRHGLRQSVDRVRRLTRIFEKFKF